MMSAENQMAGTVTLPREVVQQAIDALEYHTEQTRPISKTEKAIVSLRAALDAPATVDCRGCAKHASSFNYPKKIFKSLDCDYCTDFDKFQALPLISLTKVTK